MAHVEEVSQADACAWLARFRLIDPEGRATVQSAVEGCSCWRLSSPAGCVVFALSVSDGFAWVSAAAGATREAMTAQALSAIEHQARAQGARRVGFQTARRGLVRRSRACGYVPTRRVGFGFVMEKNLAQAD